MTDEIRRRFGSESEMNMQNVAELAYVNACKSATNKQGPTAKPLSVFLTPYFPL